jgi:hypothetical protein
LTQIQNRIQSLQDKFVDGDIDNVSYKEALARYTKEQQRIENKLNEDTQTDLAFKKMGGFKLQYVQKYVELL